MPFGEHFSNRYCRQESSTNAKITGSKYDEKQNICIVSKYLLRHIYYFQMKNFKFYNGETWQKSLIDIAKNKT